MTVTLCHKDQEVTTHDTTLEQAVINNHLCCSRVDMAKLHDIDRIVDGDIDTTHHALIVAKEEYSQATHAVDGDEEGALFIAMDDIETTNLIHSRSKEGGLPCWDSEQRFRMGEARYRCPEVWERNAVCRTGSGRLEESILFIQKVGMDSHRSDLLICIRSLKR